MPGKSKYTKLDMLDEIDKSYLIDLWGRDELYAEDIYVSEKIFLPLVLISENGCIVIATSDIEEGVDVKIREYLGLNERQMILIKSVLGAGDRSKSQSGELRTQCPNGLGQIKTWDYRGEACINRFGERILSDDLIESVAAEIENLIKPEEEKEEGSKADSAGVNEYTYEGVSYVFDERDICDQVVTMQRKERIDEETLTLVYALLKEHEGKILPSDHMDTFTDDEGNTFVKKYKEKRVLGISTGLVGEKEWYQVSEIDEKVYALKTAIFGFTGFHKFIVGEILEGVLYALTCGGAGLLPVLDVLSIICGDYRYKRNEYEDGIRSSRIIYLKKLKDIRIAAMCLCLSAAIGFLMTRTLYMFTLERISEALGIVFQNTEMIKGIGGIK